MPWSDPNDPNNPWNRRRPPGGGNQPPDLDEVIRRIQERLGGLFGGGKGGGDGKGPAFNKALLPIGLVVVVALWFASGLFMVAADEQAVVLRFGQYNETQGPGLHWHLPYPVETVEKVPVTRIQRLEVGFREIAGGRMRKVPEEALMLTKDENIVDISFVVQFRVRDLAEMLFNIANPVKTVHDAAETAVREVIGRTPIDDVLTERKSEVEIEVQELIQSILDDYGAGLSVSAVKLQDVKPPEQVIEQFKDVASAREDRERAKNEAQAYANDIIPKARGRARELVLEAEGDRAELLGRAKGEAARFEKVLEAYRKAPEVTRKRLYLETMQEVLARVDKVIVDGSVAERVLPYLPIDRNSGKVEVKK